MAADHWDRYPAWVGTGLAAVALLVGCAPTPPATVFDRPVANETAAHSAAEFQHKVLRARTPVVVDFYARWCVPCRRLALTLARVAPDYARRVAFVKVDTDRVPGVAVRVGIESLPTLVLFEKGQEVGRLVGTVGERRLRAEVDALAPRAT